jgi:hypothetical protein
VLRPTGRVMETKIEEGWEVPFPQVFWRSA